MKKRLTIAGVLLLSLAAFASAVHVWTPGETINYVHLNSNFSHIHGTMVGGHGPRLVNSDVSASAAIQHSKMAVPGLLPKHWATVAACTSNPCTVSEQSPAAGSGGISSVGWTSAGLMTVNFPARTNATFAPVISARGTSGLACVQTAQTTTTVTVQCFTTSTGAATNSGFSILIMDVEN